MTKMPWRHLADKASAEAEEAEAQLEQIRAQTRHADRVVARALWFLAENHITPKVQLIIREGRR